MPQLDSIPQAFIQLAHQNEVGMRIPGIVNIDSGEGEHGFQAT